MSVAYRPAGPDALADYATVSAAFEVRAVVEVTLRPDGAFDLAERALAPEAAYEKDYDALPGGSPLEWPRLHPVDDWHLVLAVDHGRTVGGVAVAPAGGVLVPLARPGSAVLWDIRVSSERRGEGIGAGLFEQACDCARSTGALHLAIETQDTNVPACRFYQRSGCELIAVAPGAYADTPEVAHETRLVWSLALS